MGAGGLVVTADALFFNRQKEIVTLAARHAIPAIYEWRDFVLAGATWCSQGPGDSPDVQVGDDLLRLMYTSVPSPGPRACCSPPGR